MQYNGYEVTQSPINNHIWITKDGQPIAHINCTEKKSDEELMEIVDFMLEMREKAYGIYLNDNGTDDLD